MASLRSPVLVRRLLRMPSMYDHCRGGVGHLLHLKSRIITEIASISGPRCLLVRARVMPATNHRETLHGDATRQDTQVGHGTNGQDYAA
jgi:hypothetical protein